MASWGPARGRTDHRTTTPLRTYRPLWIAEPPTTRPNWSRSLRAARSRSEPTATRDARWAHRLWLEDRYGYRRGRPGGGPGAGDGGAGGGGVGGGGVVAAGSS